MSIQENQNRIIWAYMKTNIESKTWHYNKTKMESQQNVIYLKKKKGWIILV